MAPAGAGRRAAAPDSAAPVSDDEFAGLMRPFEPFEPAPRIAVAVSGGPDSLALTLLLDAWARARGGAVLGLTMDHGLRSASAVEARWVGKALRNRGIDHAVLHWQGTKPDRVRQAQARQERYLRLRAHCADQGILHLAIGHQREDRAETVLLRIEAGSGVDGLAGIAHEREMPELRLIRPLLTVPKARLQATLRARGQPWIEDPSNRRPAFARVRMRARMPWLAGEGLDVAGINAFAGAIGRARRVIEQARNALLAQAVAMHPAGFATLDPQAFAAQPAVVADGALARVLLAVGGRTYPPRSARLERLGAALRDGLDRARTLGGCRVVPRRGRWLVVREAGRAPRWSAAPGARLVYDGRFEIEVAADAPAGLMLAPLGEKGWAALTTHDPTLRDASLPPPARPALIAVHDPDGVREVPSLGWLRPGVASSLAACAFAPRRPLAGAAFTVAER